MSKSKLKVQVLEGADNKLDLAKLEDVLKRKLIIPSYQRPYAWKSEDINEIFQTIDSTLEDNGDICFFGSIILSNKENGFGQEEYHIIDGQQRLSSFLLILRLILDKLKRLSKELQSIPKPTEQQIKKKMQLECRENKLSEIIKTVDLKRETQTSEDEQTILNFIKRGGSYESLPGHLNKKIVKINEKIPISNETLNSSNVKNLNEDTDEILKFLDIALNKIKFCLICITGKNSEDFAINLFNTLNTTGQPLTAFEVLKSELYTINKDLSKEIDNIQSKIIKLYTFERKKIVTHTGKLLLYLALYRGDFKEEYGYTLSDTKFKNQRSYLKQVLNKKTADQLVKDIKTINNFYSENWLRLDSNSLSKLLKNDDEQVCFQFLSELKHERVLPILIRFYKKNTASMGKCVKICTAFSSLWRAYHDGGASGIDNIYKDISQKIQDFKTESLNNKLKEMFLKRLPSENIKQAKETWIQKLKTSAIYKNKTLSKFLLFLAYNQKHFDKKQMTLKKGKGINILNIHHWQNNLDYQTIEHIIPKSNSMVIGHIHTLGNLTLLPQTLNSSVGNKDFSKKHEKYTQFCSKENEDKYPYLPVINHIAHYNQFEKEDMEDRSEILSQFIWQTLAEDWLGWKD